MLQDFNEKTIFALKNHSGIKGAEGSITFLEIILLFWKIVNVKGRYADVRLLDPLRERINKPDDENLLTLHNIADMVQQMGKKSGSAKLEKELSTDTANGFISYLQRINITKQTPVDE